MEQSVDLMDKGLVVCLLTSGADLRDGDFPGEHDQQPARKGSVHKIQKQRVLALLAIRCNIFLLPLNSTQPVRILSANLYGPKKAKLREVSLVPPAHQITNQESGLPLQFFETSCFLSFLTTQLNVASSVAFFIRSSYPGGNLSTYPEAHPVSDHV